MSLVNSEDVKLLTLAQAALKRNAHEQCAALRDSTGRTHVGSSVALTSLQLDALQVALAMALSSGADAIEAAVVVGREPHSHAVANIREVSTRALIWFASADGSVTPL